MNGPDHDFNILTQQQQSEFNRLFKDLELIIRNAKRTGKTLEKYLTDFKIEPVIAAQLAIKAQQIENISRASSKSIEGAVGNHKNIPEPRSKPIVYDKKNDNIYEQQTVSNKYTFKSMPEGKIKMKDAIIERFLDIIKWAVIIFLISVAVNALYPKYYFTIYERGPLLYRCNKITGRVVCRDERNDKAWIVLD